MGVDDVGITGARTGSGQNILMAKMNDLQPGTAFISDGARFHNQSVWFQTEPALLDPLQVTDKYVIFLHKKV